MSGMVGSPVLAESLRRMTSLQSRKCWLGNKFPACSALGCASIRQSSKYDTVLMADDDTFRNLSHDKETPRKRRILI